MRNYHEHLMLQRRLTETLARSETQHFHSVIYSDSNDAENYFIRAPVLNDCWLKRAAALNYSHDRKFVVAGECLEGLSATNGL